MKYNKSEIMKRAWEIARNVKSVKQGFDKPDLSHGLEWAWKEAKDTVRKNDVQQKGFTYKRYIEKLDIAESKGLNHGRAWVATEYHIETKGVNPAYEGEYICYVYAA